jgi:hypothetical protein
MAFVINERGTRARNDRVAGHCVVRHRISYGGSVEVSGEGELG